MSVACYPSVTLVTPPYQQAVTACPVLVQVVHREGDARHKRGAAGKGPLVRQVSLRR